MAAAGKGDAPDAAALLAWYDRHRRRLPWRAEPGEVPDPYRVWLSEVMLQQTTVKAVEPYYRDFLRRWPSVEDLAAAPLEDVLKAWAGLGYYARARNLHRTAEAVAERHGGAFPREVRALQALPGVGDYTAAAVAAIAFGQPATVVDGNVERVLARVYALPVPIRDARPQIRRFAAALTPSERPGDFAQATMDLGATICTPRRPACVICPWREPCRARALGAAEAYPVKAPKVVRPCRFGAAFLARRQDGAVLLRRRAERGLLGGMTEVPTSRWGERESEAAALEQAPLPGRWRPLPGAVQHVFTHFRLELEVFSALFPEETAAPEGTWWSRQGDLAREAIPTVMRKVLAHGLGAGL